ncbi:unnamed protein product, partial [marine sediment metagenome]
MSGRAESYNDARELIHQLKREVHNVDKDDLSLLAKMHGWCAALTDECREESNEVDAHLAQDVASLAESLEELILGEAEDADAALASMRELVSGLAVIGQAPPVSEPASGSAAEDDVAARLARVFDDDASSEAEEAAAALPVTVEESAKSIE